MKLLWLLLVLLLTGCAVPHGWTHEVTFYQGTQHWTACEASIWYAGKWDRDGDIVDSNIVHFTDLATGRDVTLSGNWHEVENSELCYY